VAYLDYEQIGRAVVMLAPTSAYLRHASITSTLRDYIHPAPLSASDFIRDLFLMPLEEAIDKWYGSRLNATRLAAEVMDAVVASFSANAGRAEKRQGD
jgi:hypothetical protein